MTVKILQGDCQAVLKTLADESVHCVISSPPYFGLRDYGTGAWEGGDQACDHKQMHALQGATGVRADRTFTPEGFYRGECKRCGAKRVDNQIGLEITPEEFVATLVDVFREVRRVLRKDGTLWLNLGDSYANDGKWGGETGGKQAHLDDASRIRCGREKRRTGLKPKDLIGIPWRVAFALQADGWWLRQDIIWSKRNPMPESVTDRCTKSHEHIFLLTKSESYFYDADAIAEEVTLSTVERLSQPNLECQYGSDRVPGKTNGPMKAVGKRSGNKLRKPGSARGCPEDSGSNVAGSVPWEGTTRNKRDVWTVATQPFSGEFCTACRIFFEGANLAALRVEKIKDGEREIRRRWCRCGRHDAWLSHFATFPHDLIEPCVLAGCPSGGTILDPFGGAGTTGLVADRLHRSAILIELNPDFAEMARQRVTQDAGMFSSVEVA